MTNLFINFFKEYLRYGRAGKRYLNLSLKIGLPKTFLQILARLNIYKKVYRLQIEITTKCHLKCVMCEHTYWHEKAEDMSFEKFKAIINSLPSLSFVSLKGIGETLLNAHFAEIAAYLVKKRIQTEFTTSFSLPVKEKLLAVILKNIDIITVSIDAGKKETYESIRRNARWEYVVRNLHRLIEEKRKLKRKAPEINIVFTILQENFREMREAVHLFTDAGVNGVCLQIPQLPDMSWHIEHREYIYKEVDNVLKHYQTDRTKITFAKYELDKQDIALCRNIYNNLFITVTGDVFPCCFIHHSGSRSDLSKYKLGNIFKLKEKVLLSQERFEFIKEISQGHIPHLCARCPVYKPNPACRNQTRFKATGIRHK